MMSLAITVVFAVVLFLCWRVDVLRNRNKCQAEDIEQLARTNNRYRRALRLIAYMPASLIADEADELLEQQADGGPATVIGQRLLHHNMRIVAEQTITK